MNTASTFQNTPDPHNQPHESHEDNELNTNANFSPSSGLPATIDTRYSEGVTAFAFKLYDRLLEKADDGANVFASPLSVVTALSMVLNGAKGNTQSGMLSALEAQGMTVEELNTASKAFKHMLETMDDEVTVNIANSIWPSDQISLVEDFDSSMQAEYDAEVRSLDYSGGMAEGIINTWVSDKTNQMITSIVDELPVDTLNVLVNAIYFYGSWTTEFDPDLTEVETFTKADGTKIDVDMMKLSDRFQYQEFDSYDAIRIPYGEGKASMLLLLPHQDASLEELHQSLSANTWEDTYDTLSSSRRRPGTLWLPKFKAEYGEQLQEMLQDMGMSQAFSDSADFSGMIQPPDSGKIDQVIHKAVVEVDEKGTEAAAATVVGIVRTTSIQPIDPPFFMSVDRPFFFAIESQGVPVFYGSLQAPTVSE